MSSLFGAEESTMCFNSSRMLSDSDSTAEDLGFLRRLALRGLCSFPFGTESRLDVASIPRGSEEDGESAGF
jgi:hypothetical protein